jgi:hypothetical protein
MSDKDREAFERAYAKYVRDWSDEALPIKHEERDAYKAGWAILATTMLRS